MAKELSQILSQVLSQENNTAMDEFINKYQPYDLAEMIMKLADPERILFFEHISPELGAEIIEYLDPELQYRILDHAGKKTTIALLNHMSSDKAVDLLLAIHPYQAKMLIEFLPPDYRKKLKH